MQQMTALMYTIAAVFITGIIAVALLGLAPGDHTAVNAVIGGMVTMAVASLIQNFKLDKVQTQAHAAAVVGGESVKASKEAASTSKANNEKLSTVEGKLDNNTAITTETKDATNGRLNDLLETARREAYANGKAEALHQIDELVEQAHRHREANERNVIELKKQLAEMQAKIAGNSGPPH